MARSFASGLVWGLVVVGAGLALISQLAPPPKGLAVGSGSQPQGSAGQVTAAKPLAGTEADAQTVRTADQPAAPAVDAAKPVVAGSDGGTSGAETSASGAAATAGTNDQSASQPATQTASQTDSQSSGQVASQVPTETVTAAAAGSGATAATSADATQTATSTAANDVAKGVTQPTKSAGAGAVTEGLANQIAMDAGAGPATPDLPASDLTATALPATELPVTSVTAESAKAAPGKAAALPDQGQSDTTVLAQAGSASPDATKADPAQAGAINAQPKAVQVADAAVAPVAAEPVTPQAPLAIAQSQSPALAPLPDVPAVSEATPALSSLDAALTAPEADQTPVTQAAAPDPVGAKDALLVPSQDAGLTEPARLPQIAATEEPGLAPALLPAVTAPDLADTAPAAQQVPAPRVITPDVPQLPGVKALNTTLPTVLKPSVPGVQTNSLPQIGAPAKVADPVAKAGAAADQPFVKYARSFTADGGKPLFVILLHDVGAAGMSREDLAKLPFPVTFVVDPLATDAKEAAKAYRDAGQEVLMLANGIPKGAMASDLAQTFQTLQDILPETVGVIDQATAGFQDNRALASLVLPVIADQGRGLVTYDRGLNAADQIARRDGVPAAVIFRRLDGEGESQAVMRRYLDRAAFKAAQEGSVVVIGDTRADTVATILQWTIEGKASGVDLAPVTAVMGRK